MIGQWLIEQTCIFPCGPKTGDIHVTSFSYAKTLQFDTLLHQNWTWNEFSFTWNWSKILWFFFLLVRIHCELISTANVIFLATKYQWFYHIDSIFNWIHVTKGVPTLNIHIHGNFEYSTIWIRLIVFSLNAWMNRLAIATI